MRDPQVYVPGKRPVQRFGRQSDKHVWIIALPGGNFGTCHPSVFPYHACATTCLCWSRTIGRPPNWGWRNSSGSVGWAKGGRTAAVPSGEEQEHKFKYKFKIILALTYSFTLHHSEKKKPTDQGTGSAFIQVMDCCHYLIQYWRIVKWTLRNKLQWHSNRNTKLFIHENAFVNVGCEMASILSRWDELMGHIVLYIACAAFDFINEKNHYITVTS